VELKTSSVINIVTTTTTTLDVHGMRGIAVDPKTTTNTARSANARIARMWLRATSALQKSKANVANHPGRVTKRVMTTTIMLVAIGMAETVVDRITTTTAKSVRAATARLRPNRMHVQKSSKELADCPNLKETKFVTTRTTMRAAIGTKATVAVQAALQIRKNIANNANALIVLSRMRRMNAVARRSPAIVGTLTLATVSAMMITTMLDATGMVAIVVAPRKGQHFARNASA